MFVACHPDIHPTSPDVGFFSSPHHHTVKPEAGDVDNSIDIWKRLNGPTSVLEKKMKTVMTLIMAMTLTALTVNTGMTATLKCEVSKVDGAMVVLDCGDQADKLEPGVTVKVRTEAAKQAIEGC